MKEDLIYNWNEEKNQFLISSRGISFEDVLFAISEDKIIDVIENPSSNFENQFCYVIEINDYIYLVPFIIKENEYFLKTIYPSRKYNKIYK